MLKSQQQSAPAGSRAFNLLPSNSSKCRLEPVGEGVRSDASNYDWIGDKFLIILNHHTFERTTHFERKPATRKGTYDDERRLKQVFYEHGFKIFVLRNLKYQNIIDYVTAIATLDHTRTSCICVTILTHGEDGGQIYAADRPYSLSELVAIFLEQTSLIKKPKLFFVQACRGDSVDAGRTVLKQ